MVIPHDNHESADVHHVVLPNQMLWDSGKSIDDVKGDVGRQLLFGWKVVG